MIKICQKEYDPEINELKLSYKCITKIPCGIFYLRYLQQLNISHNQITEIPHEIEYIRQLYDLNLSNNQIKKIPYEIRYLSQLCILNLSYNQIIKIPCQIKFLDWLQELDISSNKIIEIPQEIKYLTQLLQLNLQNNQINKIPKELQHLTQLQELNLCENKITEVPKEIQYLTQLQKMNLSHNRITEIPKEIQHLTQLQIFYISHNQIIEIPLEIINLRNLRRFVYTSNPIENLNNPIIQRFIGRMQNNGQTVNNFYSDTQNIHASSIQQSIKQSIINLMKEIKESYYYDYLNDNILTARTKIALTEYCNDKSIHTGLECSFSDVLSGVFFEIKRYEPEIQNEIKKRINEEMNDAECKCFTGRLSRLINSLVGYSEKIQITISSAEEIGNIISLVKLKYESIDEIKENIIKEMKERGYTDSIIDIWTSYLS